MESSQNIIIFIFMTSLKNVVYLPFKKCDWRTITKYVLQLCVTKAVRIIQFYFLAF